MTQSDLNSAAGDPTALDVSSLPQFASFAVRRAADPDGHPYGDEESTLLHPRAVHARRQAFRLGRAAAHAALQDLGRDEGPILSGPDREPLWPSRVAGSISHTAEVGVALAAPLDYTDGVGIDIETRRFAPELWDQVPRPEEQEWLNAVPAAKRDDLILALFSAKESIFKAFYPRVGRFFGFDAASLEPSSSGFSGRLIHDLDGHYPPAQTFSVECLWVGDLVLTWLILPSLR